MAFIETPRFPTKIMEQALVSLRWSTDVIVYGNGTEYRNSNWSYPLKRFDLPNVDTRENITVVNDWFMNTRGRFDGFRVKDLTDYKSTADMDSSVAATDQSIGTGDSSTVAFPLIKTYSVGSNSRTRRIYKPVASSVVVSVGGVTLSQQWTVSTTNGTVTFNANKTGTITNITQAANAVVTSSGHTLTANDTVYISSVGGMTQINGSRYTVLSATGATFTLDVTTTGFTAYTTGGSYNTIPQSFNTSPETGEAVTAGFEFDVPVRFDTDQLDTRLLSPNAFSIDNVPLVELRL